MDNFYNRLEGIIRENLENRGLDKVCLRDDFKRAIIEIKESKRALIITGFAIKEAGVGETDGPLGSVALARAIESMNKEVTIITDKYSYEMIKSAAEVCELSCDIIAVPDEVDKQYCLGLFDTYNPTHLIAIERPGRAKDNRCYSMRGEDITSMVPNTDIFFELAKSRRITTIAIGDGGNELGMGKISNLVKDYVPNGQKICASIPADILVVAGVSNWGGYGIVAGLSIEEGRQLLQDKKLERRLLRSIVKSGAVDGCTKKNEMSIDGMSFDKNLEVLRKLEDVVGDCIL